MAFVVRLTNTEKVVVTCRHSLTKHKATPRTKIKPFREMYPTYGQVTLMEKKVYFCSEKGVTRHSFHTSLPRGYIITKSARNWTWTHNSTHII